MSNERLLILNADDFGMCHSTNQAIGTLLTEGSITSASIMMTCPWIKEAVSMVKQNPNWDIGIHFTHTSEWEPYKWGPLHTSIATLTDDYGFFPADTRVVIEKAEPLELRQEAIDQMELALKMGLDPTNIDNHMGSMAHVTEIMLELCEKYALPLRYARNERPESFFRHPKHDQLVQMADEKGILIPDYIEMLPFSAPEGDKQPSYEVTKTAFEQIIRELKPGLTELVFHPSLDTDELKAITDTWQMRRNDFDVFRDKDIVRLLQEQNIRLTTWRELRDRQRT